MEFRLKGLLELLRDLRNGQRTNEIEFIIHVQIIRFGKKILDDIHELEDYFHIVDFFNYGDGAFDEFCFLIKLQFRHGYANCDRRFQKRSHILLSLHLNFGFVESRRPLN